MAPAGTVYRFQIELSDVDRSVYEALDLRVAQHPSETLQHVLIRVLAYALCYEEGIAFTKGLSDGDEPALWIKNLRGELQAWIDVGAPSPERLHKASKAAPRVIVFTVGDSPSFARALREATIHRAQEIELFALDPALLSWLESQIERGNQWTVVRSDGVLYVTANDDTLSCPFVRRSVGDLVSQSANV